MASYRRLLPLLVLLVALLATPARALAATITVVSHDATGAASLASAMAGDPSIVTAASFLAPSPALDPGPNAVVTDALSFFPTHGTTSALLTSGLAEYADDPNDSESTTGTGEGVNVRGDSDLDVTILKVDLLIPTGINCLRLDFAFYSEEYPEYVGTGFNDAFIAELGTSDWTTSGSTISAPNNFAFDPSGEVISINSTGATAMSATNAAGTTYDGATPLLVASTPITPGAQSLYLSIFDQGDAALDSAVLLDNLRLATVADPTTGCAEGAAPPNVPPDVDAGTAGPGAEGSAIALDGTVTDADGPSLSTGWSYAAGAGVDAGASCSFGDASAVDTTVTCTDDGSYTLTLSANDSVNSAVTDTLTLLVTNADPVAAITSPADGSSHLPDTLVSFTGTASDAGANDTHTCAYDWGDGSSTNFAASAGACDASHTYAVSGPHTVTLTVTDDDGASDTATIGILIGGGGNVPPEVDAGTAGPGAEGSAIALDGTVTDADGPSLSTGWSYAAGAGVDAGASCSFGDASAVDTTVTCTDDGSYTLTLSANDSVNSAVTDTLTLLVTNADPVVVITSPADLSLHRVGQTVNLAASVSDAGANDTHTCSIDWGDGTVDGGTLSAGVCSGSHAYAAIGVYTVTVDAADDDGGTGSASVALVVFDTRTKVTGGGFTTLGGRTSFGFVAKDDGGNPIGQIQVRAGRNRFHGDVVLTLTGSGRTAAWTGTGRWNGASGYTFEVSVSDNGTGKKGAADRVTLVIRDGAGTAVLSLTDAPLVGGNIVVH